MSANNAKVQTVIESAFDSAISKLLSNPTGNLISDLYIQVDQESGELQLFDDEENLLDKTVIFDWINNTEEEKIFLRRIQPIIKGALSSLVAKEIFNHTCFLKPLSISLTDEDFVVIEEILFLDDDTLRLDDPLLKDLDEDLDVFLAKLLSDFD